MGLGVPYLMPLTFSIDAATLGIKYIRDKLKRGSGKGPDDSTDAGASEHTVSVIMPAYNAETSIKETLESIYAQTRAPENVIVIDDCSTDNTQNICQDIQSTKSNLVYVRMDENFGKAHNINYAVKELDDYLGDITVVTDSDVLMEPDCIESLSKKFDSENVAAVTPYGYTTPPQNPFTRILHDGNSWNNEVFKIRKKAQNYRNAISVICGANTAYRTEVLKNLPIPTRTVTEDTDYTWLLQENGHKVVYDENAVIHSQDLEKTSGLLNQWFRWYSGTFQNIYIHGKDVLKAKNMFWTTVLPSMIESVPYSLGIVTLPVIAAANIAMPDQVPLFGPDYVEGFLLADFLFTAVPTAVIFPKKLMHLPQIYAYKFVGSALTLGAFLKTTYEKLIGKEDNWSNMWSRDYGFKSEVEFQKITKNYVSENIDELLSLEHNWTNIGEQAWNEESFFFDLPKKWDFSFVAEKDDSIIGYLIGSEGGETLAKVNKIIVDERFRGKGIGSGLMKRFEDTCVKNGKKEIELKALIENLAANNMYVGLSYKPVQLIEGSDRKMRNMYRKILGSNPDKQSEERRLNESPALKTDD